MLEIKAVRWDTEQINLRTIRQIVFIDEQQVPPEMEWEIADQSAHHWLVIKDKAIIGCGRLLANGKIGRMAILKDHRQQGIGFKLLQTIIEFAKQEGFFEIQLSAQTHAQTFYEKAGFTSKGAHFMEAGIEHIGMSMRLSEYAKLGTHTGTFKVQNFHQEICNMISQASRYIYIAMQDLDLHLFNNEDFLNILSKHARANRHSEIRILTENTQLLVENNSPFIGLAQRLNSSILLKEYELKNTFNNNNIIIADNDGIITQNCHEPSHITANYYNKITVKTTLEQFNHCWQFAKTPASIKQLSI